MSDDEAKKSGRILIVDDESAIRRMFRRYLTRLGYQVDEAESAEQAFSSLADTAPDLIITDVRMPGISGLELLERVRDRQPETDVIVITVSQDMQTAVRAMKAGAYDYLVKPLDLEHVRLVLERCFRDRSNRRRLRQLTQKMAEPYQLDQLVGKSPEMIELYKLIGTIAESGTPVLIRGETGTGKELIARAIHYNSSRASEPFVATNCGAFPEELLESELFGHVRGAFTGAVRERKGRFEMAGAGTVFLDEVADAPPAFQARLLRVLQNREFYPVGGEEARRTKARVIAATHQPVEELVRAGQFREDLYFRLRVMEITVPPLRERKDDIPLLARHFLRQAGEQANKDVHVIPDAVMSTLEEYDWPGNVRELEHAITRAVVLARGPAISVDDLELEATANLSATQGTESGEEARTLAAVERAHVQAMLNETGGNKRETARVLDISRSRLYRMIDKYELSVPD